MTNVDFIKYNNRGKLLVNKSINIIFDICLKCVGHQLLTILHYIYTVYLFLRRKWNSVQSLVVNNAFINSKESVQINHIRQQVISFSKVPSHMVFILGSEPISYRDIVKIIEWCFPAGIAYISFYNYDNGIDPNQIFETVCKYAKQCIQNIKWGKAFCEEIKECSKQKINGFVWKPKVTVHVYMREDGLDDILEVVKKLYNEGVRGVEQKRLDEEFRKRISAPDPDLAVVCGQILTSYAFLPWHLRITQFQLLDSHHKMTAGKFLSLLRQYSRCEQRYGK